MHEKTLEGLLKTKLKMINSIITILPPKLREQAADIQRNVLKVVNEVTKEYMQDKAPCKSEKELKSISID